VVSACVWELCGCTTAAVVCGPYCSAAALPLHPAEIVVPFPAFAGCKSWRLHSAVRQARRPVSSSLLMLLRMLICASCRLQLPVNALVVGRSHARVPCRCEQSVRGLQMTTAAVEGGAAGWLCALLTSAHSEVRAAAVFALASFIQARRCAPVTLIALHMALGPALASPSCMLAASHAQSRSVPRTCAGEPWMRCVPFRALALAVPRLYLRWGFGRLGRFVRVVFAARWTTARAAARMGPTQARAGRWSASSRASCCRCGMRAHSEDACGPGIPWYI